MFIHTGAVKHLGLRVMPQPGLSIKLANGDHISNDGVCPHALLTIGDESFVVDLYSLPLTGFNLILGVHWLCTLGLIMSDFSRLTMQFWWNSHIVTWSDIHDKAVFVTTTISIDDNLLEVLIVSFADLFSEPCGLPLTCPQDHRIHLLSAAPPIAVKPYRYPELFKDDIKLYELDDHIVKDKFPVSVVDKLLDELADARFFTKLDPHIGFHQALINAVLKSFICRFMLVFFDDILVFSSSCADGVAIDSSKVVVLESWLRPQNDKALWGFLGLTGYYYKFITEYGVIVAPLTVVLKKGVFTWSKDAEQDFVDLKHALMSAPILQLPALERRFIIECDAFGMGFGTVLHQGDGIVAYFSSAVALHHAKLPAYERELIGVMKAMRHWSPYLWARSFTVRTDLFSLKYILDQCLPTILQHTWVSKLFGYDFTVEYKPGKENTMADALSRHNSDDSGMVSNVVSSPRFQLYDDLRAELPRAPPPPPPSPATSTPSWLPATWTDIDGILLFHTKSCVVCQCNKTDHVHPASLLEPLPLSSGVWKDISMDFVERFPKVGGMSVILTTVDRFSKLAHFIPLSHLYTTSTVARAFFDNIMCLHGFPSSVVSDRDTMFTSTFWTELFKFAWVQVRMSSAFHL
ncbi:hypothetical protein QOZ80_UnG0722590 [Eleusine coracana subsp. coracana]|uniref:Integrase catalytic domain-containing protein n=1 Tax=Eleusine coracana subsp. coracana TaxID=191504 RepID=A0AAV9FYU1_ELECO|nr:hypothetical protein QOZ80_UnG0722590 [Eleusine coracana subsp. coracana]